VDATSTLFRLPANHQLRRSARLAREARPEPVQSPAERYVLDQLISERNQLREHLENVRDLANRVIAKSEAKDEKIHQLEAAIRQKDALIAALETENDDLIRQVSSRESRISALESFLSMIAEADKRE
jgi:peptidoglycan hydrolase CwlO-like protein